MDNDDFELVPLSPIRKLEKRLEKIEAGKDKEIYSDLLQMIKINQETVDELTKLNTDLVKGISDLSTNVSGLTEKLGDFVDRIEVESSTDVPQEVVQENKQLKEKTEDLESKLEKVEKRLNSVLLNTVMKKRMMQKSQNKYGNQNQQSYYQNKQK